MESNEPEDFPLLQDGKATFDARKLEMIDYELIPKLPEGSTINLPMQNKLFLLEGRRKTQ